MASLAEIHTAIADRLRTIHDLEVFDHPPQGVTFPAAYVSMQGWTDETMGRAGLKTITFDVFVFTAQSTRPADGYRALVELADPSSSRSVELALFDGNSTTDGFGGLAGVSCSSIQFEVLGSTQIDAYEAYGGRFVVEIRARS